MNSANGKATTFINQTNFSQIMVIYKNTFFYVFCQLVPVELDDGVCVCAKKYIPSLKLTETIW